MNWLISVKRASQNCKLGTPMRHCIIQFDLYCRRKVTQCQAKLGGDNPPPGPAGSLKIRHLPTPVRS
ncbi:hypothetical protein EMGBS3_04920 [Anaerolineaceae bacterium]|nr:hypothetical protein EMGBS3_04920 [Anaerolineaceae bacterium]